MSMNYYERIQRAIDYVEEDLQENLDLNQVALAAYMSLSTFYRMFFAIVGFSVKEYIRRRRISCAAEDILADRGTILDIALCYGFENGDTFAKAFKRIVGCSPRAFKQAGYCYKFERVNVMDKYFDVQEPKLLEKYPDIKVLKELSPMRVAYYNYVGKDPENHAFQVLADWLKKAGLHYECDSLRIFGYDSTAYDEQGEYGYEVCVTIPDDLAVDDALVKTKTLGGGLYAVCGVKCTNADDIGSSIMKTWRVFGKWLADSKYEQGTHQWLEEHLQFDEAFRHVTGVDLYMPIQEKGNSLHHEDDRKVVNIAPMQTVTFTTNGVNAHQTALRKAFNYMERNSLFGSENAHKVFGYYDTSLLGKDNFWYKVHISGDSLPLIDGMQYEEFPGGGYLLQEVCWRVNGQKWHEFINFMQNSRRYQFDDRPFIEEYVMSDSNLTMDTVIRQYMPIKAE